MIDIFVERDMPPGLNVVGRNDWNPLQFLTI